MRSTLGYNRGMSEERKRASASFWATVILLLLPPLYAASFGPFCWIASRVNADGGSAIAVAYQPLMRLWWGKVPRDYDPAWRYEVDGLLVKYADLGSAHDWWFRPDDQDRYIVSPMPSAFY